MGREASGAIEKIGDDKGEKEMPVLVKNAYDIKLPKMIPVTQVFPDEKIKAEEIHETVTAQISRDKVKKKIKAGQKAAVLVGSRGISNLDLVVKATIDNLIGFGAEPYIIPAMGSHGGGVAEEQKKILASYGVTEEAMGVPVISHMDTIILGETLKGVPVHGDAYACKADAVIPIGRIKTHTDYNGSIESGLCKMLSIGIGKHNGCARLHQEGFDSFHRVIPEVAEVVLSKLNIPFGIAIIENAHENLHMIEAVPGEEILEREPYLLTLSKSLMPRINFKEIDVLIVEKMGKNITGAGMDPNIIGRRSTGRIQDFDGPDIKRIVVLGLTPESHHNAIGVALADFITRSLYRNINPEITYANAIASGNPGAAKIPIIFETEDEALRAAVMTCAGIDPNDAKIVRIQDTLHLVNIMISENMRKLCENDHRFIL